jgi:sorting nexin-29
LVKQVRKEEKTPTAWRTLNIPNTQKGSKDKCENYKGITLLPQIYKILSSVLRNRVVRFAETTIGDYQNGFRSGRATTDSVFILRQIIEKVHEYKINLHVLFVNFNKSFDSIKG